MDLRFIIHLRDTFRASKIMQQRALSNPKIEVSWNSSVVEAYGDENGRGVLGGLKVSMVGVFAAGDVQDKKYRQATTAAGTGCTLPCSSCIPSSREHRSHRGSRIRSFRTEICEITVPSNTSRLFMLTLSSITRLEILFSAVRYLLTKKHLYQIDDIMIMRKNFSYISCISM